MNVRPELDLVMEEKIDHCAQFIEKKRIFVI